MARSKPDDVKVTTGGGLSVVSNPTEHMLPSKRMERALTKLQDAQSALKLAAEELAIVDADLSSDSRARELVTSAALACGKEDMP